MDNDTYNNYGILDPDGINTNPLTDQPYSEQYKELAEIWRHFPAYKHAQQIINDIRNNQVILVISGTGSGKTVLIPKYVLHAFNYNAKIAVTLPKQIIAKSAAEFAAKTLDVELGQSVGYQFKGESQKSDETRLLYATDGTIVALLLKDPLLSDYNAVVIDEAHERKVQIDFLLYLLRNTLQQRLDFKLIIMSATIDERIFASYFENFSYKSIFVGAATHYPIESIFLDEPITDKEYLDKGLQIIRKIEESDKSGDILFFVTSVSETQTACDYLKQELENSFCVEVFAGMNSEKQEIAQRINTTNKRKIIIATNVAESSLTITGIKYVIDSGYEIASYYDPELRARVLEKRLISRAQALQRQGRTGRTGPGVCYHLYTENDFRNKMREFPEPSIRTSNIYGECLRFLHMPNVRNVTKLINILSSFIESPSDLYIKSAILQLMQLGLILNDQITPLGDLVARLQLDPMQGVTIIMGYKLLCSKELTAIFALIETSKRSIGELFNKPKDMLSVKGEAFNKLNEKYLDAKRDLFQKNGDHLSLLKIFSQYRKYRDNPDKLSDWCYKHFLKKNVLDKSYKSYQKIKKQIQKILHNMDFSILPNIDTRDMKLEDKIMFCIGFGFRLNIDKMKYKINRDSFMNYIDLNKIQNNIVYDELVSNGGKIEYNIVSRLPKSVNQKINEII